MKRFFSHQLEAFKYSFKVRNPKLFMDMRLGKSLVFIRRSKLYKPKDSGLGLKILIVAPNSAIGSWIDELTEEGETRIELLQGTRKQRIEKLKRSRAKWFIINTEGFIALPEIGGMIKCPRCNGAGSVKYIYWRMFFLFGLLKKRCGICYGNKIIKHPKGKIINWDCVCLDESTSIKNPGARVSKFFINNFKNIFHLWIMTGTPNPESDMEYFPQFKFCDGEFLGMENFWLFRKRFFRQHPSGFGFIPRKGTPKKIEREVGKRAFIMRRSDAGINIDPIITDRFVEMPNKVKKVYDKAENDFILEIDGNELDSTIWATTRYIWLRRLCGGWVGDKELIWNGKNREVIKLLKNELAKEFIVIWFNFNLEAETLLSELKKKKISCALMTGKTKKENDQTRKTFQAGGIRVLLIQQKIAQTGMNLSRADTAIYFSEPCGLLARQQTEMRIANMNKKVPPLIINLLVKDSVDTDIRKALSMKSLRSDLSLSNALKYAMMERRNKNEI